MVCPSGGYGNCVGRYSVFSACAILTIYCNTPIRGCNIPIAASPTVCIPRSAHLLAAPGIAKQEPSNKMKSVLPMFVTIVSMKSRRVRLVLLYSQQFPLDPHSYCHRMQALSKMTPKRSGPGTVPSTWKASNCRPSENVRCSSATDLEGGDHCITCCNTDVAYTQDICSFVNKTPPIHWPFYLLGNTYTYYATNNILQTGGV